MENYKSRKWAALMWITMITGYSAAESVDPVKELDIPMHQRANILYVVATDEQGNRIRLDCTSSKETINFIPEFICTPN